MGLKDLNDSFHYGQWMVPKISTLRSLSFYVSFYSRLRRYRNSATLSHCSLAQSWSSLINATDDDLRYPMLGCLAAWLLGKLMRAFSNICPPLAPHASPRFFWRWILAPITEYGFVHTICRQSGYRERAGRSLERTMTAAYLGLFFFSFFFLLFFSSSSTA